MSNVISPEKEKMARQRERKLAAALRSNLRRRKEQTRGVAVQNANEPAVSPADLDQQADR